MRKLQRKQNHLLDREDLHRNNPTTNSIEPILGVILGQDIVSTKERVEYAELSIVIFI